MTASPAAEPNDSLKTALAALAVGGSIILPGDEYDPNNMLSAEIENGHRYIMQPTDTSDVSVTRWA